MWRVHLVSVALSPTYDLCDPMPWQDERVYGNEAQNLLGKVPKQVRCDASVHARCASGDPRNVTTASGILAGRFSFSPSCCWARA